MFHDIFKALKLKPSVKKTLLIQPLGSAFLVCFFLSLFLTLEDIFMQRREMYTKMTMYMSICCLERIIM